MNEPIFTIIDTEADHTYKIFADGRIEGFPENVTIVNGIAPELAKARDSQEGGE